MTSNDRLIADLTAAREDALRTVRYARAAYDDAKTTERQAADAAAAANSARQCAERIVARMGDALDRLTAAAVAQQGDQP